LCLRGESIVLGRKIFVFIILNLLESFFYLNGFIIINVLLFKVTFGLFVLSIFGLHIE
jgi:hypothetical protein